MRNTVVSAAVAAVVGVVAAMLAAASGFSLLSTTSSRGGKKMVHATINLDRVGGSCFITTTPQTLEAYKRETVEWSVVDRCGVLDTPAKEVTITFIGVDPIETSCVKKGRKKIRCVVRSDAAHNSFYKYKVEAPDAETEDPEIEIVQ